MEDIVIKDLDRKGADDIGPLCVLDKKNPALQKGIELKTAWAHTKLREWGPFAKLAYHGSEPAGMIQYQPHPDERIVSIDCIFVPYRKLWRKGIAKRLTSSLIEDVKKPLGWFDNEPALALITKTFPGEGPDQYPAREFFRKVGFQQVGDDPDFLYYPLEESFVYKPPEKIEEAYVAQQEDKGKTVLIYGPSFCPFEYHFLRITEGEVKNVAPDLPVRWIDETQEPEEVRKRGGVHGLIVNAHRIKTFVLRKEEFRKEVEDALKAH